MSTQTPWWRLFVSPVADLIRPRAAARVVLNAGLPAIIVYCTVSAAALWFAIAFVLVSTTLDGFVWYSTPSLWSEIAIHMDLALTLLLRSTGTTDGPFSTGEPLGLAAVVVAIGAVAFVWLNLPLLHGRGSLRRTIGRAAGLAAAWAWPVAVVLMICPAMRIALARALEAIWYTEDRWIYYEIERYEFLGSAIIAVLLLLWLRRAVAVAAPPPADLSDIPPRCEGCGYQLYDPDLAGLCPECARPIRDSLVARWARPGFGVAPRNGPGGTVARPRTWWQTALFIVLRPSRFYACVPLRVGDDAPDRFARRMYPLLWLHGAIWVAVSLALLFEGPLPSEAVLSIVLEGALLVAMGLTVGTLVAWLVHRSLGALVFMVWHIGRVIPDARWLARCMGYETAWLHVWPALVWPGVLLIALAQHLWSPFGGLPGLVAAAYVACASALWLAGALVRYERIRRAIRWSNA